MKRFLCVWLLTGIVLAGNGSSRKCSAERDHQTVGDAVVQSGKFSKLVNALTAIDLLDVLKGDGPFTVFAPTDEAFAKLSGGVFETLLKPENKQKLKDLLTYHVVTETVSLNQLNNRSELTSLSGKYIRLSSNGGHRRVNNATITRGDFKCANGIIHVIDSVLMPSDEGKRIPAIAKQAGRFQTLLTAVKAADLFDALNGDQPLTVLAPTDDAFAKLPKGTLETLLLPENKSKLRKILEYHVIRGKVTAKDAVTAGSAQTLAGKEIKAKIDNGRLLINDATVTANDIKSANGIIHQIDRVLIP